MKKIILFVVILIATSHAYASKNGIHLFDEDYKSMIIGTWICEKNEYYSETTYNIDKKLKGIIITNISGNEVIFKISGNWDIVDGVIIENYTECNYPEILKDMEQSRDKIISISENQVIIITDSGIKHIHKRKTP